jgi:hypothetical protein
VFLKAHLSLFARPQDQGLIKASRLQSLQKTLSHLQIIPSYNIIYIVHSYTIIIHHILLTESPSESWRISKIYKGMVQHVIWIMDSLDCVASLAASSRSLLVGSDIRYPQLPSGVFWQGLTKPQQWRMGHQFMAILIGRMNKKDDSAVDGMVHDKPRSWSDFCDLLWLLGSNSPQN